MASPLCPHRDSSLSPGGGRHTPQLACTRCPTCRSHTAYTGHVGCRGSVAEGGTGTGDSWPAERRKAKGTARPSGCKGIVEEHGTKGHTHGGDSTVAWVFTGCQKGTMRYLGSLRHEIPKQVRCESQKGTPPHTALPVLCRTPATLSQSLLQRKRTLPHRGTLHPCNVISVMGLRTPSPPHGPPED